MAKRIVYGESTRHARCRRGGNRSRRRVRSGPSGSRNDQAGTRRASWSEHRQTALEEPLRIIVSNAGHEGAMVVGKVKESKDVNFGFDAERQEFGDMIKAGILDPAKVSRTALQNAASIASLMLTTHDYRHGPLRSVGGMSRPRSAFRREYSLSKRSICSLRSYLSR